MKKCPACGITKRHENAEFCPDCGGRLLCCSFFPLFKNFYLSRFAAFLLVSPFLLLGTLYSFGVGGCVSGCVQGCNQQRAANKISKAQQREADLVAAKELPDEWQQLYFGLDAVSRGIERHNALREFCKYNSNMSKLKHAQVGLFIRVIDKYDGDVLERLMALTRDNR